ncbi:Lysoplasmalogenase-like protein TMEM86A [Manis javanica]|nr:Lysoplasmalogenase-like protein TMEM86A [Manis javanica]
MVTFRDAFGTASRKGGASRAPPPGPCEKPLFQLQEPGTRLAPPGGLPPAPRHGSSQLIGRVRDDVVGSQKEIPAPGAPEVFFVSSGYLRPRLLTWPLQPAARLSAAHIAAAMVSPVTVVKSEGPKLVPFFKATCVYFVLWLPSSSPSWFSALIKCLPIFCLCLFLLAHGLGFLLAHPSATRIFVGLVFSAVGDAFLIWQDQGYFTHGLLMFAVAHVLYASAFGMRSLALQKGLVMAVLSGLSYALLYPCLSDLTLALNKFCFPVPYARVLIMSTYYAAQMFIALSAVESREPVEDDRRSKTN